MVLVTGFIQFQVYGLVQKMKFTQRVIRLVGDTQKQTAIAMLNNLPLGHGLEIVARETPKARSLDANALMWAGPLKDIAEQCFIDGRLFTADSWNIYFKVLWLPDGDEPNIAQLVTNPETYKKWDILPNGERNIVGSTKQLTPYGMGLHIEQLYAFGASHGVLFSEKDFN